MVTTAEIIMKTSLLGSQETDGTKNLHTKYLEGPKIFVQKNKQKITNTIL
jgi:hypothetical protein